MPTAGSLSEEAYLAAERPALVRSEYLSGAVIRLPATTNAHALIGVNVTALLTTQVSDRNWTVRGSTMRLYAPAAAIFTYPDASLVCGEAQLRAGGYQDNLLNPTLLVKVLPHAIPAHFQEVFEAYYTIPTMRHVLLITEYAARVSLGSRNANGLLNIYGFQKLDDIILLPDLKLELPLAEIYRKVPLLA